MTETHPAKQATKRPRIAAILFALLLLPTAAHAEAPDGWRRWWLPRTYSEHGPKLDLLFNIIFIVCAIVFIGVFFLIIKYCIKYRHRDGVKAHFSHGNKRLELIWTVIPAVLLLALSFWTKAEWDNYRYSGTADDPKRAQILVIAQQFKWNVVYPGPDGKFGRYLIYPRTTDLKWPQMPPGDSDNLAVSTGVPGPAFLPPAVAKQKLDEYIANKNPLGKDFSDPDGVDDLWKDAQHPVYVPKGRPIDIYLTSKDVIHDFFLPDFRVKLDAVPGMLGHIYFTATTTNAELEKPTQRQYSLDELSDLLNKPGAADYRIIVPPELVEKYSKETTTTKRVREKGKMVDKQVVEFSPIISDAQTISLANISDLKGRGVTQVEAIQAKTWEVVCQQLCGVGHTTMQDTLIVLDADEYAQRFEGKSAAPPASQPQSAPATQPAASISAAR